MLPTFGGYFFFVKNDLKADLDVIAIRDFLQMVSSLADAVSIFVHRGDISATGAFGLGGGVKEGRLGLGQGVAGVRGLTIPDVILHKAHLAIGKFSSPGGQGPFTDHDRLVLHGIDQSASPSRAPNVLDLHLVVMFVIARDLQRAAHACTTIGSHVAILVLGCGTALEGGKDGVDHVLALGIGDRLEPCVADFFDVKKVELLGEIKAADGRSVGHVERERDVV